MGNTITSQILFPNDLNAIINALGGTGVVSGWTCTDGGGWVVDVAPGTGYVGTSVKTTSVVTSLTHDAADASKPRRDAIVWDTSAGALAIVKGTAAAIAPVGETNPLKMTSPVLPDMTAPDDIMVAEVYLPAGAGSIAACTINDKRMLVQKAPDQLLTTAGDIIQRGSSGAERLAIGTAYQKLRTNSGASALEWANDV
jgi:hypothetical protein